MVDFLASFVAMSWLGWLLAGAAIVGAFLLFRKNQQNKKWERENPTHHPIMIDDFPITHVPTVVETRAEAEKIVAKLRDTYRKVWAKATDIYGKSARPMPISTIGMSPNEINPEHPHIHWPAPVPTLKIRLQPTMYYWFAHECHNINRYVRFGMNHIYKTSGPKDRARALKLQAWIEKEWGDDV